MEADSERLVAYLVAMFEAKNGIDLRGDENAMKRVHEAAERARHEWLANNDAGFVVNLPFITATERGPLHLDERLSVSAAKRVFAGDGFSEELAAARAERDRTLAAKRKEEEANAKVQASEERIERAQSRKMLLVVALVLGAFAISVAALMISSRSHTSHADDEKAHSTEHR